jgi:ATP-binding cassette, subfamily G (WHITE), member 2, SNQ2
VSRDATDAERFLCSFVCWWFTAGFPSRASRAGPVYLEVLLYEMLYTGIGQFVAGECRERERRRRLLHFGCRLTTHILLPAYAPNAAVAQLVMPIILGTLVSFSGVLVPYAAITPFWRYWLYYINVSFLVYLNETRAADASPAPTALHVPHRSTCLVRHLGLSRGMHPGRVGRV